MRSPSSPLRNQKGFFLLAMVAVILATGLAASIAFLNLTPIVGNTSATMTFDKAEKLRAALTKYRLDHGGASGTFPATLAALVTDDATGACTPNNNSASTLYLTLQGWCGPYLDISTASDPTSYSRDGWGNTFSFTQATGVLYSFGPNGIDNAAAGDDLVFSP